MFLLVLAPNHGVFWCIFTNFNKFSKISVNLNEKTANLGLILAIFYGFEPIFKSKTTPFFEFSSTSHEINCNSDFILLNTCIFDHFKGLESIKFDFENVTAVTNFLHF